MPLRKYAKESASTETITEYGTFASFEPAKKYSATKKQAIFGIVGRLYIKSPNASQNININIRNTAICIFLGSSAKNVNIPHAAVDSISMYINAKYAILYVVSSREVILFATKFITLDAFMIINCGDEYISSSLLDSQRYVILSQNSAPSTFIL